MKKIFLIFSFITFLLLMLLTFKNGVFIKKVSAQQSIRINDQSDPTPKTSDSSTTVIKFEPILEYIEGYAYDDGKKAIPNAKVNVKLQTSKKTYYSTTTDESGFFTIYPKNLPPYEFYLELINPKTQKIITQKTSEFVKKNQTYLDTEKIDLIQATKQDQKIDNITSGAVNEGFSNNNISNNNPSKQNIQVPASSKSPFNPTILIVVLIIFLLVIVTLGLVFYIKKSSN